jgi:hypothetical protein
VTTVAATVSIEAALNDFLLEQRRLLSDASFRNYLSIVDLLCSYLNGYAYDDLGETEARRWRAAFDAGDGQAFCHLFGPEKIAEHVDDFLGWFMVRKVIAGPGLLRAAGPVVKRLLRWLKREEYVEPALAAEALERAAALGRALPRAERLAMLLFDLTEETAPDELDEVADEAIVEDLLSIERVEPGALFFEGGIGPLAVPEAASELAEVGWEVNAVLAPTPGGWRLLEVGCVYP